MPNFEASQTRRYGVAVLAVAVAGVLTFMAGKVVQPVPLLLFLTAVAVSARCGGLGPGLLATLAGALLTDVMQGQAGEGAGSGDPSGVYHLALFILLSVLISGIGGNLRQAQRTLEESRHLFQSFMDHCPAFAFMKDRDGRYVYMNGPFRRVFDLPAEGWLGKTDFELWPARTAAVYRENDAAVLAAGEPREVLEPITVGGKQSYWLALKFPFCDRRGRLLLAGMAVDVTDRLRLEEELGRRVEELAAADRRKNEFLAMLAHELRNPLAAISNASYILEEARLTPARSLQLRRVITHQTQHLIRLVDDLLDVSRITRGKVSMRMRRIDLSQVARNAVECVRPLVERRRHRLTVELPAEPIELQGDPDRLEQVVVNLLTNAARYTEPGGQIELVVETEEAEAIIRVRDTGTGIAPEMLERIFEPFRQADETSGQCAGGMGIGLALARNLVDRHGGAIRARSAGIGRGSEFTVCLPLTVETGASASTGAGSTSTACGDPQDVSRGSSSGSLGAPAGSLPLKVLVVDDNTCAAETLAELLEFWGYTVRTSDDGPRGLVIAREWKPQVVLLDLQMPGMDGYEVARRLRASLNVEPQRIVALTGCGYDVAERVREAGFDTQMLKPVDPEALRHLLQEVSTSQEPEDTSIRIPSMTA